MKISLCVSVLAVFFLMNVSSGSAQQLFAPNTNSSLGEYPYRAVELPGQRYAFTIARRDVQLSSDELSMFLLITDSVGTVIHSLDLPTDSTVQTIPKDLFYADGRLYAMTLIDTNGIEPQWLQVMILDTTLNIISEKYHRLADSGRYVWESFSEISGNRIFSFDALAPAGDFFCNSCRSSLSQYDLNGELVSRIEVDTNYFSTLENGPDYSIVAEDISLSDDGVVYLMFNGAKPSLYSKYIAQFDTAMNFTRSARLECWDLLCDTSFLMINSTNIVAGSGPALMGAFIVGIDASPDFKRNSVVKMNMEDATNGSLRPSVLSIIPDATTSQVVKTTGRKGISRWEERIYTLGIDMHSFGPLVNTLIITRADTNANIIWTKYLESDGRPFEPRFILATSDGGCLVAAIVYNVGPNPQDHYIFKLDGNGHFTSVQRLEQAKERIVKVYPNPASSVLNFELDKAGEYSIVISDMNGRRVLQNRVKGASQTFEVSHLAEGMYQYAVYGAEGVIDSGLWLKQ